MRTRNSERCISINFSALGDARKLLPDVITERLLWLKKSPDKNRKLDWTGGLECPNAALMPVEVVWCRPLGVNKQQTHFWGLADRCRSRLPPPAIVPFITKLFDQ